ncbi:MAG: T9SS type A sorting domain-containing protein [Brumimicrobium sp.]
MKKNILLFSTLLLSGISTAQFNPDNAPQIGESIQLYVIDSTAASYHDIVGDGVTWDYTNLEDYGSQLSKSINVIAVSETDYESTFNLSDKAIELEGELTTYFTDDANARISQGLVFNDPELGDLVIKLDNNGEEYYNYPFNLNDEIIGTISGEAQFSYNGVPFTTTATGNYLTRVDGRGTLKLGVNSEYTDVLRYKMIDTVTIEVPIPGIPNYRAIHEQYEYYDFSVSNLPIFTHSSLWFGQIGTSVPPRNDYTLVLSLDSKTSSISKEELTASNIYPNPANNIVNIDLTDNSSTAQVSIVDAMGRVVLTTTTENGKAQVNVSSLDKGTYFVKIAADDKFATKTLVVK